MRARSILAVGAGAAFIVVGVACSTFDEEAEGQPEAGSEAAAVDAPVGDDAGDAGDARTETGTPGPHCSVDAGGRLFCEDFESLAPLPAAFDQLLEPPGNVATATLMADLGSEGRVARLLMPAASGVAGSELLLLEELTPRSALHISLRIKIAQPAPGATFGFFGLNTSAAAPDGGATPISVFVTPDPFRLTFAVGTTAPRLATMPGAFPWGEYVDINLTLDFATGKASIDASKGTTKIGSAATTNDPVTLASPIELRAGIGRLATSATPLEVYVDYFSVGP